MIYRQEVHTYMYQAIYEKSVLRDMRQFWVHQYYCYTVVHRYGRFHIEQYGKCRVCFAVIQPFVYASLQPGTWAGVAGTYGTTSHHTSGVQQRAVIRYASPNAPAEQLSQYLPPHSRK